MAITVYDPDERRRQNAAVLLQALGTFGQLAQIPSQIKKAQFEGKYYDAFSRYLNPVATQETSSLPATPPPAAVGNLPPLNQPLTAGNVIGQLDPMNPLGSPFGLNSVNFKGLNVGPNPLAIEAAKGQIKAQTGLLTDEAKRRIGVQREAQATSRFLQRLERSYTELIGEYPEIGQKGLMGFGTRKMAQVSEKLDNLPMTSAFLKQLKPAANKMARDIEGGKITDQDRSIYADSFANSLTEPSETNVRVAADSLIDLYDKGADIRPHLKQLSKSKVDVMKEIANAVYQEFPDLAPKGKGGNKINLSKMSKSELEKIAYGD